MRITDAVLDPGLGCAAFTVERITLTRTRSGTVSRSETAPARGCVHPGTPEMLRLLPEEEKADTFIAVYTDFKLSTGAPGDAGDVSTAPDRILWNGRVWRVVRVRDWHMFGYCQALAVLVP